MRKGGLAAAGVAAALLITAVPARAADPTFLTIGAGVFDIGKDETAGDFRLEYRLDKLLFIKPLIGVEATTDGAVYGYGGFNIDIYFGSRWVVSPGFAFGLFEEGDGKDLGNTVEFRSGAEFAYRFANRARLGVSVHHISNASLGDKNPGTETVFLNYSIPLGRVFTHD